MGLIAGANSESDMSWLIGAGVALCTVLGILGIGWLWGVGLSGLSKISTGRSK